MSTQQDAASSINAANQNQSSAALLIQTYCLSVKEQPFVDFSGEPNLSSYQTTINDGLKKAQDHAHKYLDTIQPSIIDNISNISNYYALHNAVVSSVPVGSTTDAWIDSLTALKQVSDQYEGTAATIVNSLTGLRDNLNTDAASFQTTVSNFNSAVNGDNGVLASDNKQLSDLQTKIDGAIAGVVTSCLAIVGGSFLICVGAITDFVTAGVTTPAVIGGIGIVTSGVGGEIGASVNLVSLNRQKGQILKDVSNLKAEVKLATSLSAGYQSLLGQVKSAVNAAQDMQNAWNALGGDLKKLTSDLQSGTTSADIVQKIFLTASNTIIQTVMKDIDTIKNQMAGVQVITAEQGQTVGDLISQTASKAA